MLSFGGFGFLFSVLFVVIFLFIIGQMVMHTLFFGSVFHTVSRLLRQRLAEEQYRQATEENSRTCEFCGGFRGTSSDLCPQCGAPLSKPV